MRQESTPSVGVEEKSEDRVKSFVASPTKALAMPTLVKKPILSVPAMPAAPFVQLLLPKATTWPAKKLSSVLSMPSAPLAGKTPVLMPSSLEAPSVKLLLPVPSPPSAQNAGTADPVFRNLTSQMGLSNLCFRCKIPGCSGYKSCIFDSNVFQSGPR